MPTAETKRVLVVVFDALKPQFVTPDLMPELSAFAARGVRCANSHSTFFTETRVNQSAVTSGCMAYQHGLVANRFVAPDVSPDSPLNTGDDTQLEPAFERANGRLIGVPTLGEILSKGGKSYASLSAGTQGGGRLINHSAAADGTFRYTMRRPEASCPPGVEKKIEDRFGPLPKCELPATEWITRAVDVYLDYIEPEVHPDVMLLWLCEPDESFHYLGIGSEGALTTIRHVDHEFGRILERHREEIDRGDLHVIAMSDHGQITLAGERLDMTARLCAAGFTAGTVFDGETECIFAGSNAGGIWLRDDDPALRQRLVTWLHGETWCGPVFTRDGTTGTLLLSDIFLDHPRAPDIALVMQADGDTTAHDSSYPAGGGSHGGTSRHELHNFLALGGTAFKSGLVNDAPCGNIDITPTVLSLLGLPLADHFDGRVIDEALADGPDPAALNASTTTKTSTNTNGPKTHLTISQIGHARYIDQAWRD
ncbi:MAG: alkaline phosphatase family protein [Hyphomicrobiaceae bacterium]